MEHSPIERKHSDPKIVCKLELDSTEKVYSPLATHATQFIAQYGSTDYARRQSLIGQLETDLYLASEQRFIALAEYREAHPEMDYSEVIEMQKKQENLFAAATIHAMDAGELEENIHVVMNLLSIMLKAARNNNIIKFTEKRETMRQDTAAASVAKKHKYLKDDAEKDIKKSSSVGKKIHAIATQLELTTEQVIIKFDLAKKSEKEIQALLVKIMLGDI